MNVSVDKLSNTSIGVQVQPNPAHESCQLVINSKKQETATIQLFNTLGQSVLSQKIELLVGKTEQGVDLKDLPVGVYRILVTTERSRVIETLMVY